MADSFLDELIAICGLKATRKLLQKHGGKQVSLPKYEVLLRERRDLRIYIEYTVQKFNKTELSRRWSLTTATITAIIKRVAQKREDVLNSHGYTVEREDK